MYSMTHERITQVSMESFKQRSKGRKFILLYPWTSYKTLFLSHFLSNDRNGLLYYRIADDQSTLQACLRGLVQELDSKLGGFGKNLKAALSSRKVPKWSEALAADLGAYHSDSVILYLDELDRIPFDDDFNRFITSLADALPAHVQIAVSSRLLTYRPWSELVSKGDAVVLGTEKRKDDVIFTVEKQPRPQLEVYALGRGYAIVNGQYITNWDGELPRNLFFFFVDRPMVTRQEIFDVFWPNLPTKEATNVFHVTKRKISERISMKIDPTKSFELTQYNAGFYTPSEKLTRHYDVNDFQADVERAMITGDEAEEERLLLRAVEAYRAPYLQEGTMEWMRVRRDHLRTLNAQALISLGRLNKRRGDDLAALGFFTRALTQTPEREDIQREVMSLYLKMGRKEDARAQYLALVEYLRRDFDIKPSQETQDLYALIENS